MGVPVVHFEIMGGQGNQIEKFYGERFGWKINSNNAKK
jgi:predicted enzyme related to lactoylglutathione lyase